MVKRKLRVIIVIVIALWVIFISKYGPFEVATCYVDIDLSEIEKVPRYFYIVYVMSYMILGASFYMLIPLRLAKRANLIILMFVAVISFADVIYFIAPSKLFVVLQYPLRLSIARIFLGYIVCTLRLWEFRGRKLIWK